MKINKVLFLIAMAFWCILGITIVVFSIVYNDNNGLKELFFWLLRGHIIGSVIISSIFASKRKKKSRDNISEELKSDSESSSE